MSQYGNTESLAIYAEISKYNREKRKGKNPAYQRIGNAIARAKRKGDRQALRNLRKQRRNCASQDPHDPDYRRLRYVRYADDWALGFSGPKAEAEEIKREVRDFLRETLKLELSEEKTLITHTRTSAAKFLGYGATRLVQTGPKPGDD